MWLTPKNWLSPNSSLSIRHLLVFELAHRLGRPARGPAAGVGSVAGVWSTPAQFPGLRAERRRAPLRVRDHERDHPIGFSGAVERVACRPARPRIRERQNARFERCTPLHGGKNQPAAVSSVVYRTYSSPTASVAVGDNRGVTQVHLDLLAISRDASSRAPGRDPGRSSCDMTRRTS